MTSDYLGSIKIINFDFFYVLSYYHCVRLTGTKNEGERTTGGKVAHQHKS